MYVVVVCNGFIEPYTEHVVVGGAVLKPTWLYVPRLAVGRERGGTAL